MPGHVPSEKEDGRWMRLALTLARRGEGLTRPNPPVGAVVVRDGRVVGAGFHRRAGGPHAEVYALRRAGAKARGATLYVTLEPCSTRGRTPPCTEAIRRSGVRRVVAAVPDPNPRHRGRGLRLLRRAGLSVASGVGAGEAAELLAPFARWVGSRRPFVTLKLALSLDGRIADAAGRSRWITGPAARGMVQALRRLSDAVMVGAATAAADNPSLLPVPPAGRRPYRVVVDGRGRLPAHARLLGDQAAGPTIVCTTRACPARRAASYRRRGATVWTLPARAGGRVSLRSLMRRLHGRGVLHVLCEGGGELAASLIRDGLVDRYVLFVAPRVIGGRKATPAVGGRGWAMGRTPGVRWLSVRRVGEDLMIVAVPEHRRAGRRRRVGE